MMEWVVNIAIALAILLLGRIVVKWLVGLLVKMMAKSELDDILINFISSIVKAILLLLVIVAALDQLGVDTTSLIALIGAAGLAVGLALQNSLQNFAAGVMLVVFRPFKLADFIEAGGVVGVQWRDRRESTGGGRELRSPPPYTHLSLPPSLNLMGPRSCISIKKYFC